MSYRVPVSAIYRKKSPLEGLQQHMGKVKECISLLRDGFIKYVDGEYEHFHEVSEQVSKLEHEADLIKGNIRAHLPRQILMPVDKRYFLWELREQDAILDHAENLAQLLDLRHTPIPDELKEDFKKHMDMVMETIEEMEKAVENMKDLVKTGFAERERKETKRMIHSVHKKEWEADQVRYVITKKIYEMEDALTPMNEYHLLKIVDWVDDMADHAENVVDWLRAMIAK
ncbi:MAG: TIGR00153 family protein [Thermoplasmata archaeon]|nr:MAG: TIGR00153 family protein [Thermoplasmata archaeon]RLF33942.1 MAG: TIGR00153 family protein [Thermoplasmata archaeon]